MYPLKLDFWYLIGSLCHGWGLEGLTLNMVFFKNGCVCNSIVCIFVFHRIRVKMIVFVKSTKMLLNIKMLF